MKIVINTVPLLSPLTGIGNCILHLIKGFQSLAPYHEYTYYYSYFGFFTKDLKVYDQKGENKSYHLKENIRKIPLLPMISKKANYFLSGLNKEDYDVYFEPNFIPLKIKSKKVVTTVYDFSFHHHHKWHSKDRIGYFKKNFYRNIKRSDVIITNSNFVKKEAVDILGFDESRIKVIPLGYDRIFNTDEALVPGISLPEKYILFVGSIEPRKNLVTLLKAYKELPDSIKKEFKLLLAGFKGWENKEIVSMLDQMKGDVEYLGYVGNEMLAYLYKNAVCFVYPSLYEGFGLPPLEAMACGCPVIVSDAASLPEVCGKAAYYIDPGNIDSISESILKVVEDESLRVKMRDKGVLRAKLFSWEKAAREHLDVFEKVLNL